MRITNDNEYKLAVTNHGFPWPFRDWANYMQLMSMAEWATLASTLGGSTLKSTNASIRDRVKDEPSAKQFLVDLRTRVRERPDPSQLFSEIDLINLEQMTVEDVMNLQDSFKIEWTAWLTPDVKNLTTIPTATGHNPEKKLRVLLKAATKVAFTELPEMDNPYSECRKDTGLERHLCHCFHEILHDNPHLVNNVFTVSKDYRTQADVDEPYTLLMWAARFHFQELMHLFLLLGANQTQCTEASALSILRAHQEKSRYQTHEINPVLLALLQYQQPSATGGTILTPTPKPTASSTPERASKTRDVKQSSTTTVKPDWKMYRDEPTAKATLWEWILAQNKQSSIHPHLLSGTWWNVKKVWDLIAIAQGDEGQIAGEQKRDNNDSPARQLGQLMAAATNLATDHGLADLGNISSMTRADGALEHLLWQCFHKIIPSHTAHEARQVVNTEYTLAETPSTSDNESVETSDHSSQTCGITPLMWASSFNFPSIIGLLVRFGANPDTKIDGANARSILAHRWGLEACKEVCGVLDPERSDVNQWSSQGADLRRALTSDSPETASSTARAHAQEQFSYKPYRYSGSDFYALEGRKYYLPNLWEELTRDTDAGGTNVQHLVDIVQSTLPGHEKLTQLIDAVTAIATKVPKLADRTTAHHRVIVRMIALAFDKIISKLPYLIDVGLSTTSTPGDLITPLMFACRYNFTDVIMLLMGLGADPNVRNDTATTRSLLASHYTTLRDQIYSQSRMTLDYPRQPGGKEGPHGVNCSDPTPDTTDPTAYTKAISGADTLGRALLTACEEGDLRRAQQLVHQGADHHYSAAEEKTCPLHVALHYRKFEVALWLLVSVGVDPYTHNKKPNFPLVTIIKSQSMPSPSTDDKMSLVCIQLLTRSAPMELPGSDTIALINRLGNKKHLRLLQYHLIAKEARSNAVMLMTAIRANQASNGAEITIHPNPPDAPQPYRLEIKFELGYSPELKTKIITVIREVCRLVASQKPFERYTEDEISAMISAATNVNLNETKTAQKQPDKRQAQSGQTTQVSTLCDTYKKRLKDSLKLKSEDFKKDDGSTRTYLYDAKTTKIAATPAALKVYIPSKGKGCRGTTVEHSSSKLKFQHATRTGIFHVPDLATQQEVRTELEERNKEVLLKKVLITQYDVKEVATDNLAELQTAALRFTYRPEFTIKARDLRALGPWSQQELCKILRWDSNRPLSNQANGSETRAVLRMALLNLKDKDSAPQNEDGFGHKM